MDVTKYGVVYGGVQKNIGPAGVVIAIIREDLITDDVLPGTPTMLKWKTQADADSLYNTPPCLSLIHISEPTRRTPISYAVFCLKKKKNLKKKT